MSAPSRLSWLALLVLVLGVSAASQWWAQRQTHRLGPQVATLAAQGEIRMLSSDTCALCVTARAWMKANEVAFTECSIERDAACRQAFEASRSPGTPVMLVRGQVQVGFSPQRVLEGLQSRG